MFAKPLTILCVFILAIVNFLLLLAMLSILVFPVAIFLRPLFAEFGYGLFFYFISKTSAAILTYILFDSIFGFTMRRTVKGLTKFKKADFVYHQKDIITSFDWLKKKFKIKNVTLYLDPDAKTANAYAIGSFTGNAVVITLGLINRMQMGTTRTEEFLDSVRGVLGHEMAHLSNKDFLPGLITAASQDFTVKAGRTIKVVFTLVARIFAVVPGIGPIISAVIIAAFNALNFILMAFFRFVFLPVFDFIQKFCSRSIEYRCDRESAYAYGGYVMEQSLALLGKNGYTSIFSTHPTTSSRIKNVKKVVPRGGNIRPGIINIFANIVGIGLIVFICVYSNQKANVPDLKERFRTDIYNPAIGRVIYYKKEIEDMLRNLPGKVSGKIL